MTVFKLIKWFLVSVIVVIFTACGSNSSNDNELGVTIPVIPTPTPTPTPTLTGQFIDATVQGLDYSCSSGVTSVTNSNGEYICDIGDDVTFSIGSITIGTVAAQSVFITPYSLFPGDTVAAVNLARLLQSLDLVPNNKDVIIIDNALVALLPSNLNFSDPNFIDIVGIDLVSSEDAISHLNDAIILNGGDVPDGAHIPVANAGTDQSVVVNTTIILDGTNSYDADGDTLSYVWAVTSRPSDSNSYLFTGQQTATPAFTPDVEGEYVFRLIVNDGVVNSSADTVTITSTDSSGSSDTPPPLTRVTELMTHNSGGPGGIALDSDDNLYVAGECYADYNGDVNVGYHDILVAKYDSAGNFQWSRLTGTSTSDLVEGVAFDKSQDALYVVGHTTLSLHSQPVIGNRDIFIIKYDTNGSRLWTIMDGTTGQDRAYDIALDSKGNIYVTGFTYDSDVPVTGLPTENWDIFIAKYSSDGSKVWRRQFGGSKLDAGYGIAIDTNDNVYITGRTASDTLDGETSNGSTDVFISKYSSAGVKQWIRLLGTVDYETGFGIATDSYDNAYITGFSSGNLEGNINQGKYDAYIAKYNTSGALIWTTSPKGSLEFDYFRDIVIDSNGDIFTVGDTQMPDMDDGDYRLSKFDASGQEIWTIEHGTDKYDYAPRLALDSAENIYVHGLAYGRFPESDVPSGGKIFVAKYGNNTSSGGPYSVGGIVDPTYGTITLTNNGGDDLEILEDGSFTFDTKLNDGASYKVEAKDYHDDGQACYVSGGSNGDGSGTINGADVIDINVSCVGV